MNRPDRGFRPEIQALRAVAVLLVVGYHLYPNRLSGGYVGVDVFFVISGYLITSHLCAEVARTGRLSLSQFWARRIRRLLPAASVVLGASFLAMLAVVPHALWERTVTEIAASAMYAQNWVLAASSVDYLGADNTPSLVQHFWSLSVEEQFYFVWPILITAAIVILPRRKSRSKIAVTLSTVFAGSLLFSVLETARSQPSAYFHTGTRAWEFAAGGLLALAPTLSRRWGSAAGWTGLILIIWSAFEYTPATPFPGAYALVPVAGTLLVIASSPSGLLRRLAELLPVQVVGDLSYSIYLWHWPLIVATPYTLGHDLTTVDKVGIFALSLALAALSKRFVEDPVRRAPALKFRPARSYVLATATIFAIVAASTTTYVVVWQGARSAEAAIGKATRTDPCFGARAMVKDCARPYAVPKKFDAAFWATNKGSLGTCDSKGTTVTMCDFGDTTNPRHTVALVGNSHAGHLVAGLEDYGNKHHWRIILMRKSGCSGALPTKANAATWQGCVDWSQSVNREITAHANGIDIVAFASNNDAQKYVARTALSATDKSQIVKAISANLEALQQTGRKVLVFGDVPGTRPEVAPECIDEHRSAYDPCATARSQGSERDDFVAEAARRTHGVGYVDLLPYFCDESKCHDVIGGAVVYIDEHHLTASYSRSLGPYLGASLSAQLTPRAARPAAS